MRFVVVIISILIVVGAALWVVGFLKENRVASEPWPAGLGTLNDVPRRFPKAEASPAAAQLTRLAAPLAVDFTFARGRNRKPDPLREALTAYLKAEIERTDTAIEAPPEAVGQYLAAHAEELAAVRRHLLTGGPVTFPVDLASKEPPMPNLLAHMQLFRLLDVDALDRARRGELVAWDDLEATWRLARPLLGRPEQISQLVGLAGLRQTNAVARKMPLPAPYWLAEMAAFDVRPGYLQALQAESWTMWQNRPKVALLNPYGANLTDERRWLTGQLAAQSRCSFDGDAFVSAASSHRATWNPLVEVELPNLRTAWERLFRTRAELELTERAVTARAGGPQNPKSACSDGQWIYEARPDGRTNIRFSAALPEPQDNRPIHYPAQFVIARQ